MKDDILHPWYDIDRDEQTQQIYNRSRSAVYIYEPPAIHKAASGSAEPYGFRPADVVLMELTVRTRKDLDKTAPFEWPDDFYRNLCVSWRDEQMKQGLCDIAYLCGQEAENAAGRYVGFCIACWYSDGKVRCFIPTQNNINGTTTPVIEDIEPSNRNYRKPKFTDNAASFKDALQSIADYADFEWWKNRFRQGLSIMNQDNVGYYGQEDTFSIPQPYFKYLLAAQVTRLGAGMGSWYDLPTVGTVSHKKYTNLFTAERNKALMYAINNC